MEIEKKVHEKFLANGKKIAFAESCTGGLLMSSLTKFPGASNYLLGGVVCYSNELKERLLNVSIETLKIFGAVSQECALEMSTNLLHLTTCDIAVSVTGILGPSGGSVAKPVGTVFFSIIDRDNKTFSMKIPLPTNSSRENYLNLVKNFIMEELWKL
jgi:PncC family amidohydrolase